jgi:hypothetical protein
MRKTILLFSLIGLHAVASAQQKNIVWGYLKDSITQEPIVLASVTNLSSKQTVMTSHTGRFKIQLTENQLLSFAAVGYHFDTTTFHAINLKADTLMLFLSPLTRSLANVTVSAKGMNAYQLDSIERRKDFMGDRVNYAKPAFDLANSGAGLGISLDRFSKHEKEKRKAFAFFEANEKEEYINYRFPASLVTKYSGLKDEALENFMQQYRPSYEWLRKHRTEEDMKYYINEKLKEDRRR